MCDLVSLISFPQRWLHIKNHTQGRTEGTGGTRGFLGSHHCSGRSGTALPHLTQQHRLSHRAVACPLLQSISKFKPSQTLVALQKTNRRHTSNQQGKRLLGTLGQKIFLSISRVGIAKNKCRLWRKVLFS